MTKTILLSFDIEEFDLPLEYNFKISEKEQFKASSEGLKKILSLLEKTNTKATFFVTTSFAKKHPEILRKMQKQGHEISSHGLYHSDSYSDKQNRTKITKSKKEIEKITKQKIKGFRAPRFDIANIDSLFDLDFLYDSSIHPTFIPGRYNNLLSNRKVHKRGNIIEIPPSTLPFLRIPIAWVFFRNLGINYSKLFTRINHLSSEYTMLIFHPWEFQNLTSFKLPKYIKRNTGEKLINLLKKYILWCQKKHYNFKTFSEFLNI